MGTLIGYAVTCTADSTTEGRRDERGLLRLWEAVEAAPGGFLHGATEVIGLGGLERVAPRVGLQAREEGLIAEHGGFEGIEGLASGFEYWSLARKAGRLGYVASPVGGRNGLDEGGQS